MAKKFAGFKPETLNNKILPALGYNGPTDQKSINQFLASNPAAAAKMGKYTMVARQMVEGKPIKAQEGVVVEEDQDGIDTTEETGNTVSPGDITENILADPTGAVTRPTVVGADIDTGLMDSADESLKVSDSEDIVATKAGVKEDLVAPEDVTTTTVDAQQSEQAVRKAGEEFEAAKGEVSADATYDATTIDPTTSAVLDLKTEEGTASLMDLDNIGQRTAQEGELIYGSTVDQERIEEELAKEKAALVSDELARLTKGVDEGNIPPYMAASMRIANAQLQMRGLSASSAAGQALILAAQDGALEVAKLDAANKQQMAVEKAKIRADFLDLEFTQEQESRVENAATITEIANKNYDTRVTIELENSKLLTDMEVANLSARSAKTVADTAALASLERTNLNNVNTAASDNAKAFLDMDMKNLDNEQEVSRIRFQETANAIINDTAQKNAAEQFNAAEENDAEQFILSLANDVAKFNMDQQNAMERFNAGEENAMKEFNEEQKLLREKFNAEQYRIIEQHNSTWKQTVTTDETAAINAAYEVEAKAANDLSKTAYNNIIMEMKDMMYYAFTASEGALDRNNKLSVANINAGSGGELEQGLIDIATEFVTSYVTAKFKPKGS